MVELQVESGELLVEKRGVQEKSATDQPKTCAIVSQYL
jgi:hypothetical protein